MRNAKLRTAAAGILAVVTACQSQALAISYRLTELSPLDTHAHTMGITVNARGDVAGISSFWSSAQFGGFAAVETSSKGGAWYGALYRGGSGTALGRLPSHLNTNVGYGINDNGHVVGLSGGGANARAFLYDGASMDELSGLDGLQSRARAINNNGQIVGWFTAPDFTFIHAFRHDGTTLYDLGSLGGGRSLSLAYDINDANEVTGASRIAVGGPLHAFLHDGTTMHDLGTLGGLTSEGRGVSSLGHVTGFSSIAPGSERVHAFLYDGTTMRDLGTLEFDGGYSIGYAVNSLAYVVGQSAEGISNPLFYGLNTAFLYTPTTGMVALSSLVALPNGWTELNAALDINDAGQITGYGLKNGDMRGFLLTPVPEPGALVLAALALVCGLIGARNRRAAAEQVATSDWRTKSE